MQPINGENIIKFFEEYTDDLTELSSEQELALANKIYGEILSDRPWEFLRTAGSVSMVNGVGTLPEGFLFLMENYADTVPENQPNRIVIFGSDNTMFEVIPMGSKMNYQNNNSKMYIDFKNQKIMNTGTYTGTITFDYQELPDDIALDTEPIIPSQMHMMIVHGMCIDDDIIQKSEKARSYMPEHKAKYDEYMRRLARYNNRLLNI